MHERAHFMHGRTFSCLKDFVRPESTELRLCGERGELRIERSI